MDGDRIEHRVGDVVLRVHRRACMAHGDCMEVAPEVFTFGEDGIVTVRGDAADPGPGKLALACAVCPEAALEALGPDGLPLRPGPRR